MRRLPWLTLLVCWIQAEAISTPLLASPRAGARINAAEEQLVYDEESVFYDDEPAWDEVEPPVASSASWFESGLIFTEVDAVVMHRSRPDAEIIARDNSSTEILDQEGRGFGLEPGIRLTVGRYLDHDCAHCGWSLECTALGLSEWEAEDSLEAAVAGNLFTIEPFGVSGFFGADVYTTEYRSSLRSLEFNARTRRRLGRDALVATADGNWIRELTPGYTPSALVGVRFLSVDEDLKFLSRQIGVPRATFGGDYLIATENDLVGLHVGADCIRQTSCWSWGIEVKAGLYANFQEQSTEVSGSSAGVASPGRDETATDEDAAFVGELNFLAGYHLRPNLVVRAEYNLLGVTSLALASDQLSRVRIEPVVAQGGGIFYQGVSLGLETTW